MGTMENDVEDKIDMWKYLAKDKTRRTTVIALWSSFLIAYLNVTIALPYLPQVMKDMGAEETWVGVAFAFQPFGVVMSQLLCGKVERWVGNSVMFCGGAVVAGVATFLSAFLMEYTDDTTTFIALLCLFRFLNGFGEGFLDTACLNLYQVVAPGVIAQVVAVSEGCIGVGVAIGPLLGGGLYDLQGFELPMIVGGVLVLAVGGLVPYLLKQCDLESTIALAASPNGAAASRDIEETQPLVTEDGSADDTVAPPAKAKPSADDDDKASLAGSDRSDHSTRSASQPIELTMSHKLTLALIFFNTFTTCYSMGAMDAITPLTLTDDLGYSSLLSGLIFGGVGLVYLVVGLLLGKQIDRQTHENRLTPTTLIVGAFINFVSCVLLGPAEWFPDMDSTWTQVLIISGIILNGIGMAFALIPGMSLFHVLSTSHSMASTLFNASLNLGIAIGAPLCGWITHAYSYPRAMMTTYALAAACCIIITPILPTVFARAIKDWKPVAGGH